MQQDTEVERSSRQPIPLYLQILSHHLLLLLLPCFLRDLIRSSTPFLFLLDLPLCWLVNVMRRSRAALIEKKTWTQRSVPPAHPLFPQQPPPQPCGADLPLPPPPPRRNVSVFNSPTSPLPDNERWTYSFASQPQSH